jgi:dihydroxy-acid dehydratase
MKRLCDPVLLALGLLLMASLAGFFSGVFPYPFGFLVLLVFVVARILFLQGGGNEKR